MKRLYLASTIRHLEKQHRDRLKMSSLQLMERAIETLFQDISKSLDLNTRSSIRILAGPGHNGADGIGLAAQLALHHDVHLSFPLGEGASAEWKTQRFKIPNSSVVSSELAPKKPDLVIDALFGLGFRGQLPNEARAALEEVKASRIWALDLPSGINGDTAACDKATPICERSLSIGAAKYALHHPSNHKNVGAITELDIGLDLSLCEADVFLLEESDVAPLIPDRPPSAHKYQFGRLQLVAGSARYPRGGPTLRTRGLQGRMRLIEP
jgi:ADP-dependent NAD(P)H-hydrate dehydratase / NAD(P)H-hydrate epimerase